MGVLSVFRRDEDNLPIPTLTTGVAVQQEVRIPFDDLGFAVSAISAVSCHLLKSTDSA